MQEMWVGSLGREDPLEKEMAIYSSVLAWEIPWTEERGGLQSMGSERLGYNWMRAHTHTRRARVTPSSLFVWELVSLILKVLPPRTLLILGVHLPCRIHCQCHACNPFHLGVYQLPFHCQFLHLFDYIAFLESLESLVGLQRQDGIKPCSTRATLMATGISVPQLCPLLGGIPLEMRVLHLLLWFP